MKKAIKFKNFEKLGYYEAILYFVIKGEYKEENRLYAFTKEAIKEDIRRIWGINYNI